MSEPWTQIELDLAGQMRGSDIISVRQFRPQELRTLLGMIERFEGDQPGLLAGRVLAALFFEPSTRTRLSFESAMARLGGNGEAPHLLIGSYPPGGSASPEGALMTC